MLRLLLDSASSGETMIEAPTLPSIQHLHTRRNLNTYIRTLSGEILGWIIYPTRLCFSPVQRVHNDPTNGPVVVIEVEDGWDVFEVDCDHVTVYVTDVKAMAVYFGD